MLLLSTCFFAFLLLLLQHKHTAPVAGGFVTFPRIEIIPRVRCSAAPGFPGAGVAYDRQRSHIRAGVCVCVCAYPFSVEKGVCTALFCFICFVLTVLLCESIPAGSVETIVFSSLSYYCLTVGSPFSLIFDCILCALFCVLFSPPSFPFVCMSFIPQFDFFTFSVLISFLFDVSSLFLPPLGVLQFTCTDAFGVPFWQTTFFW